MVKKFLLSAAVVGALATSAMAYNSSELSQMVTTKYKTTAKKVAIAKSANNKTADINKIGFNQMKTANTLIFPAYFVGSGWETTVRVINTNDKKGVVAKVVLYDGKDSHEVRDFNIYLSPNDVWVGKIKVDSDGVAKVISTDDSAPLEDGSMASATKPLAKSIDSANGYVEVIAMAETDLTKTTYRNGHNDHEGLRAAYDKFAKKVRTGDENPSLIFANGVIQNGDAIYPYANIAASGILNTGEDITGDAKPDYNLTGITVNSLTGDVRITDTVNGKDMDLPAYKVDYNSSVNTSLVYLEGEKANVADVEITPTGAYDSSSLKSAIAAVSAKAVYITYGDAPVNNMYAILTNPFKRVYVQAATAAKTLAYYTDATTDTSGVVTNYGTTSLVAQIFDESENMMSAGQFSPATTPTIKLANEVATTGYDVNDANTLAYYLNQANAKGYTKGFVKLTNATGSNAYIPGIMTQMLATTAGGKVVTNWIIPQQEQ